MALEQERRELMPRAEAFQSGMKVAEVINRLQDEAFNNWPTQMDGKDEPEVREVLDRVFAEFTERVREEIAKIK